MPLMENGIPTLLASGSADDKVDPAKDGAIKFVISALTEQDVR
jgi:hypothetical protein